VALIDVREQHEWDEVHATGAQHLPLGELPQRVGELPGGPLMFICRSGARSARAADWVLGQGRDTTNVAGGTDAWVVAGLPTG
jgi:rhodanese-related sulfurtransferase